MPNPRATIDIVADADQFQRSMKGLDKVLHRTKATMQGMEGTVERLNRSFGEGSTFYKFAQVGMGAGAIAAVAMVMRAVVGIAEAAEKYFEASRKGEDAWETAASHMATSIPILSDMDAIIKSIANIIKPIGEDLSKQITAQGELRTKLANQLELLEAQDDAARQRLQIEQEYQQTLSQIAKLQKDAAGAQGDNALTAAKVAEQAERYAIAIRDAKLSAVGAAEATERQGEEVRRMLDKLRQEVQTFGESEGMVMRMALSAAGATQAEMEEAVRLMSELTDLKRAASRATEAQAKAEAEFATAQAKARDVIQSVLTPMEKYEQKLGELRELLSAGLIDERVFKRASNMALGLLDTIEEKIVSIGGGFEGVSQAFNRIANATATTNVTVRTSDERAIMQRQDMVEAQREANQLTRRQIEMLEANFGALIKRPEPVARLQ